jgi:hypothetical protein
MMQREPEVDPHGRLRAAAHARAERTVARLQTGIQALQDRHEQVTARTIERETGLTFKTIQRNAAAYDLYTSVADIFGNHSKRQSNRRRRGRARTRNPPVRDSLLAYKKPHLVARLRAALQQIEALEAALIFSRTRSTAARFEFNSAREELITLNQPVLGSSPRGLTNKRI